MKTKLHLCLLLTFLLLLVPSGYGQGVINGNFEMYDRANKFLPGWHIYIKSLVVDVIQRDYGNTLNGVAGSSIEYRYYVPSQPSITINHILPYDAPGLKQGDFYLWGEGFLSDGTWFIEQQVLVPLDAKTLQLRSYLRQGVYLDGVLANLSMKEPVLEDVAEWWTDVSQYAGREIKLVLTIYNGGGYDDVRFSSEPVPEPTGINLLGVVSAAMFVRRARTARCQG